MNKEPRLDPRDEKYNDDLSPACNAGDCDTCDHDFCGCEHHADEARELEEFLASVDEANGPTPSYDEDPAGWGLNTPEESDLLWRGYEEAREVDAMDLLRIEAEEVARG